MVQLQLFIECKKELLMHLESAATDYPDYYLPFLQNMCFIFDIYRIELK